MVKHVRIGSTLFLHSALDNVSHLRNYYLTLHGSMEGLSMDFKSSHFKAAKKQEWSYGYMLVFGTEKLNFLLLLSSRSYDLKCYLLRKISNHTPSSTVSMKDPSTAEERAQIVWLLAKLTESFEGLLVAWQRRASAEESE